MNNVTVCDRAVGTTAESAARARALASDDWPHTKRLMPWLLTVFLVMLFLVPFDATAVKVHLPVDSKLDRFVLMAIVGALILQVLVGNRATSSQPRRASAITVAVLVYTGIALMSVVLNIDRIYRLGELTLVEKRLSQLLAYVGFFFIVARTVRPTEIRPFCKLVLILATLTALGTLYESRTGVNLFYTWAGSLLKPIATVLPSPTNIHPTFAQGRKVVVGPTSHGLALASLLVTVLPLAVVPLIYSKPATRKRALYLLVVGLILGASLATGRKTAILAPIAAFAVLVAYHRRLLRWTPVALIALIPIIHVAAPGALGTFGILAGASNSNSTVGREQDYGAIAPDILTNVVIGRGYGSLDPDNPRWYRVLDNEYLGELFQVGILGLIGYIGIVIAALVSAHGLIKRGGTRAPPMLAAAAGCAAYGLVSATYDAMSFPQAPYTFFFAAGLIAAAAAVPPESEHVGARVDEGLRARPAARILQRSGRVYSGAAAPPMS